MFMKMFRIKCLWSRVYLYTRYTPFWDRPILWTHKCEFDIISFGNSDFPRKRWSGYISNYCSDSAPQIPPIPTNLNYHWVYEWTNVGQESHLWLGLLYLKFWMERWSAPGCWSFVGVLTQNSIGGKSFACWIFGVDWWKTKNKQQ